MINRSHKWTSVMILATVLFGAAPSALGQVVAAPPSLPPAWKVDITATASAKAAGRADFVEYIWYDGSTFTSDQLWRLGFVVQTATATPGVAGETVVVATLVSNTHGTMAVNMTVNSTSMTGTMSWVVGGVTYAYTLSGAPFTPPADPES
jgi:hypothetical protein